MQSTTLHQQIVIPQIRKITLAIDGSANSFEACETAAIIAKGCGAEVKIVHALHPINIFPTTHQREEYYSNLESNANQLIEKAMSMFSANEGIKASSEIVRAHGSISHSLINYIGSEKSDLAVCGTRGLGGFERMLLGSVSSDIASHSPSPVLVVRKPEAKKLQLKRILVATDGSECASRAVRLAISLAKALGAKLTFLNIVYLPPMSYPTDGNVIDKTLSEWRIDGERITREAASLAKENGVNADTRIIDELRSPVVAITRLAESGDYDLIALGTRGLGGFEKLFLGSVANGILHYAHCSVLVAK